MIFAALLDLRTVYSVYRLLNYLGLAWICHVLTTAKRDTADGICIHKKRETIESVLIIMLIQKHNRI